MPGCFNGCVVVAVVGLVSRGFHGVAPGCLQVLIAARPLAAASISMSFRGVAPGCFDGCVVVAVVGLVSRSFQGVAQGCFYDPSLPQAGMPLRCEKRS